MQATCDVAPDDTNWFENGTKIGSGLNASVTPMSVGDFQYDFRYSNCAGTSTKSLVVSVYGSLTLGNFAQVSLVGGTLTMAWDTNYVSTSQIRLIDQYTFAEYFSPTDSAMVSHHSAQIGGLVSGTLYYAQAISVDHLGRSVRSGLMTVIP